MKENKIKVKYLKVNREKRSKFEKLPNKSFVNLQTYKTKLIKSNLLLNYSFG